MAYLVANNPQQSSIILSVDLIVGNPIELVRVGGQSCVILKDLFGTIIWQISVSGGTNALSNGYISMNYDPKANYLVQSIYNCVVTFNSTNNYTITSGGNTFTLVLSPFPTIKPILTQTAGPNFGIGTIQTLWFKC